MYIDMDECTFTYLTDAAERYGQSLSEYLESLAGDEYARQAAEDAQ